MNVTDTATTLNGLDNSQKYNIFVVSRNVHGTSLPSSIIMVNVVKTGKLAICFMILKIVKISLKN